MNIKIEKFNNTFRITNNQNLDTNDYIHIIDVSQFFQRFIHRTLEYAENDNSFELNINIEYKEKNNESKNSKEMVIVQ